MKFIISIILFLSYHSFADDLYPVVLNNEVCYINTQGKVVISPEGKYSADQSNQIDYHTDYIKEIFNLNGEHYTNCKFPKYAYFNKGNTTVEHKHWFWFFFPNTYKTYSIIDDKGEAVKSFGDSIVYNFHNGFAKFLYKEKEPGKFDIEKYGFINSDFEIVVPAQYDYADNFNEGLALIRKDNKYGFINSKNEMVVPPEYDGASSFSNGLAPVKKDDKWGYININGEYLIPSKFEMAWEFSNSIALVFQSGKFTYIKTDGSSLNNVKYGKASSFSDGVAKVKIGDYYGFIDTKGDMKIEPKYISCLKAKSGMIGYRDGRKWGYIDTDGNSVIKPQFDFIESFDGELAIVWKDGEQMYINKQGKKVFDMQSNTVNFFKRLID